MEHLRRDRHRHNEAGFSMLEFGIYMALVAAGIAAIMIGWNAVSSGDQTNKTTQLLATLRTNMKSLYSAQPSYGSGTLNQVLIDSNAVPRSALSAGTIRNPFGGTVDINGGGTTFSIAMSGIPTAACAKMATQDTGVAAEGGVQAVAINGQSLSLPVAPTAASAACTQAGGGASGGNSIEWTMF